MDWDCVSCGQSNSLLYHEPLAPKLCLQNRTELVGLCFGRHYHVGDRPVDRKLAKLEGGTEKSGGEFEV